MAGLVRGRWEKRYINSFEDKDAYDQRRREHLAFRIDYAKEYVARHGCPDLGEDEKREIDDFWGRYGIDTGDYSWWSMYYWVTGARDPRFVPDHVMGLVLYAYYNDPAYVEAWRDKNEFDRLLPGMPFPETLLKCRRGRLALDGLSGSRVVSRSEAPIAVIALAGAGSEVIVKDSRHSGHGRGVRKYELNCAADVEKVLSDWEGSGNWIMQRAVRQHAGMAALNESSVNIYRIVTWRHGDEADVLFGAARFGAPGSITDDSYDENGVETTRCVAVGLDGRFAEQALDQDGFPVGRVSVGGGLLLGTPRRRISPGAARCSWTTSTLSAGTSPSTSRAAPCASSATSSGLGRCSTSSATVLSWARRPRRCSPSFWTRRTGATGFHALCPHVVD